jgi:hypothetical protein
VIACCAQRSSIKEQSMDRVTEFRPTPPMPWINILLGKRPDEAMSGPRMGRRCNRNEAEEKPQQSDEYLSLGQRLRYTGTSSWSVLRTGIFWSDETFFVCEYDRPKRRTEGITTWSNGRRKRSRLGNAIPLRSERSPHRPEVKRLTLVDRDSISFLRHCKADSTSSKISQYTSTNGWKEKKTKACAALKHARIWASSLPRSGECVCEPNERVSVSEQSGTWPERPSPAGRNNRTCPF